MVVKKEVPGSAPTVEVLRSMRMQASRTSDGKWRVSAPWLKDAIYADSWEDAYWLAVKERRRVG